MKLKCTSSHRVRIPVSTVQLVGLCDLVSLNIFRDATRLRTTIPLQIQGDLIYDHYVVVDVEVNRDADEDQTRSIFLSLLIKALAIQKYTAILARNLEIGKMLVMRHKSRIPTERTNRSDYIIPSRYLLIPEISGY